MRKLNYCADPQTPAAAPARCNNTGHKIRYYTNRNGRKVIAVEKMPDGTVEATQIVCERDEFLVADYATFEAADAALRWQGLDSYNKRFAVEQFYRVDAPITINGVFVRYVPKLHSYVSTDCKQTGLPLFDSTKEVRSPPGQVLKTKAQRKKEKDPPEDGELPVAWLRCAYGYTPLYAEDKEADA